MKRKRKYKLTFYRDEAKQWRWRLKSGNGEIITREGEGNGFDTKQAAEENFNLLAEAFATGNISR